MTLTALRDIAELRTAILSGLRDHYRDLGLLEIRVPQLVNVTGSCENVNTLLAVLGMGQREEAVASRGYLSQTGQLSLEVALTEVPGCWCHTTSYRDDAIDARHLKEFELIEEEFSGVSASVLDDDAAITLFETMLERISGAVRAAVLAALASSYPFDSTEHLNRALQVPFPCCTYEEALAIANETRARRSSSILSWGDDLSHEDEAAVIHSFANGSGVPLPTFVTLFPVEIKFFNMKVDPRDNRRVLSADLLLPNAGEAVGSAVRENDYPVLRRRLETSSMFKTLQESGRATLETFAPYLELIRSEQTPLHAGYGLGLERLLQFAASLADIRSVSMPLLLRGALDHE